MVSLTTFSKDGLSVISTKLSTLLMLDSYTSKMYMQSWGRSSYARAMIELRADVELKDTIMVAMPKLVGEGFYLCMIRVEYDWKLPKCSSCKIFSHVMDECLNNLSSDMGFKPVKQVCRHVLKNNINTSSKKKQHVVPRREVSNSNPFDVVNSIKNDDELGTNGGNLKSAGKGF
ncbi:hypothetical protein Tco_0408637 [Tanacetum coccineum]